MALRRTALRSLQRPPQFCFGLQRRWRIDYEHYSENDSQRDPRVDEWRLPGHTPVGEFPIGGFTTIGMPKMFGRLGSKARVHDPDTLITKIKFILENMKR